MMLSPPEENEPRDLYTLTQISINANFWLQTESRVN